jgi:hypothetical protein
VESDFQQKIDQLANREITEFTVTKEEFMEFRMLLIKREDFKHFRGIAKHNGEIAYQYLEEPRS